MTKNLPTLAVGDAVVIVIAGGSQQSAILTHFSNKGSAEAPHIYAHFAWRTGPGRYDGATCAYHSSKWARYVLAVFPKDSKFLAV